MVLQSIHRTVNFAALAMVFLLHKQISRSIYRLFAPRATDGHDVFIVEELLLETLRKEATMIVCRIIQYNTIQYKKTLNCYKIEFIFLWHETVADLSALSALPVLPPPVDPVMPYSTWL